MRARTKKHFRLLFLLLIAAGAFPFLYPWGNPMLSWQDIDLPELPEAPETDLSISLPSLDQNEDSDDTVQQVVIFRWRDENGSWHFSNTKPEQGVAYERVHIEAESTPFSSTTGEQEEITVFRGGRENPEDFNYSLEDISELIGAARKVRTEMEAHQQRLDEGMEKGH